MPVKTPIAALDLGINPSAQPLPDEGSGVGDRHQTGLAANRELEAFGVDIRPKDGGRQFSVPKDTDALPRGLGDGSEPAGLIAKKVNTLTVAVLDALDEPVRRIFDDARATVRPQHPADAELVEYDQRFRDRRRVGSFEFFEREDVEYLATDVFQVASMVGVKVGVEITPVMPFHPAPRPVAQFDAVASGPDQPPDEFGGARQVSQNRVSGGQGMVVGGQPGGDEIAGASGNSDVRIVVEILTLFVDRVKFQADSHRRPFGGQW